MAEWIKVSERLPDRNQGYILVCNEENIGLCDTKVFCEWDNEMYDRYFRDGNIKYWQELPPPPRKPNEPTERGYYENRKV